MKKKVDAIKNTQPVIPLGESPSNPISISDHLSVDAVEAMQLIAVNYSCDIKSILDMNGSILFVNPSLEKITGWSPQEILDKSFVELIHPEDRFRAQQSFSSAAQTGSCAGSEWRLRCTSGNYIWLESRLEALPGSNIGPSYIIASLRDISVRKNFEMELLKSEERYRSLIENYPCGISIIRDGKFIFFNQAGIKILGYEEPADLVGRKFETLIVPSHQKEILEIHAKMLSGIPVQGPREIPVIRKDGTQIHLSIDMSFVSMFKGPSIVCYYRDITETRQTEKYLQKRLEQLRLILQGSREVFFDWDVKTGHVEHGDIYSEMLGYDPGELKPHIDTWKTILHPEDKESALKALQGHLDGKTDFYESEHRILCKSGDYIWIEARGMVTMRGEEGNPVRVSGTHVDITRRKMLEMEIASTREDLERLVVERTNELNEANTA